VGFYRKVFEGLRRIRDHILASTGEDLARFDFMLELRRRLDESAREGVPLNVEELPPCIFSDESAASAPRRGSHR
jgi:hypothetical protein